MTWRLLAAFALLLQAAPATALTATAIPTSCTTVLVSWDDPGSVPGQLYAIQRDGVTIVDMTAASFNEGTDQLVGARSYLDTGLTCCPAGATDPNGCCTTSYTYGVAALDGIVAFPCGDVNADSFVGISDALVIAQYDVGARSCGVPPFALAGDCDVNQDGACNIGDALLVAQCSVGIRPCGFPGCGPFACPTMTMAAEEVPCAAS